MEIRKQAINQGMKTLYVDGVFKAMKGATTLEEVYRNAKRAQANARDPQGYWSLHWDGGYGLPGALYTQAANLELFAWAAAVPAPS